MPEGEQVADGEQLGTSEQEGKRVSWAELYFDLIFAFAISQTAEIMVAGPGWAGFGRALGLFVPLWWSWVGFVVLCNRYPDTSHQRLIVLAGTLPCAVAAIEVHPAAGGKLMAFTFALAGARLVLAAAFALSSVAARQVAAGYAVSTVAFAASVFVPEPWRYLLWAFGIVQEVSLLLLRNGERRQRRDRRGAPRPARNFLGRGTPEPGTEPRSRPSRADQMRAMFNSPVNPDRKVDASHLAERFGAMIIILLGEVVASVGGSAVELPHHDLRYWVGLLAGLVLAAGLFWSYFTGAAPMSEAILRATNGNPSIAYGLYAAGQLTPAFALVSIAAGVSLIISGHAPANAVWFVTGGLGAFIFGSGTALSGGKAQIPQLPRTVLIGLTVCLAFLEPVISAPGVVAVAAVWGVVISVYVTWRMPGRLKEFTDDPLSWFRVPGRGQS